MRLDDNLADGVPLGCGCVCTADQARAGQMELMITATSQTNRESGNRNCRVMAGLDVSRYYGRRTYETIRKRCMIT